MCNGLSFEQMVGFSLIHSLLGFLGCESWVRLHWSFIQHYYYYISTVIHWGCAWCLLAVVGEGWVLKDVALFCQKLTF